MHLCAKGQCLLDSQVGEVSDQQADPKGVFWPKNFSNVEVNFSSWMIQPMYQQR